MERDKIGIRIGVTAAAASQFVDVLAQTCAMENGESRAPEIELKQLGSRQ